MAGPRSKRGPQFSLEVYSKQFRSASPGGKPLLRVAVATMRSWAAALSARARRKQDHRHHTDADERANLLAQVHIITILSSLSFCLRSLVDDTQTQHKELVSS